MRINISKKVDPGVLAAAFTKALGKPIAVSTRNPGEKDEQGEDLPGVVILLDGVTGEELGPQDQQAVDAIIANHKVPDPGDTPAKRLLDAIGSAANVAQLVNALKDYATAQVAREAQQRIGRNPKAKP